MHNIEVIVFDAYGTLLNIASVDEQLVQLYGDKASIIAAKWRQKQLEYTWLRSLMMKYIDFKSVTEQALQYACNFAAVDLSKADFISLMKAYDHLKVYPDVHTSIPRLSKNYRLAILSNATMDMLENAATFNNIRSHFEFIFSVNHIQKYKPIPDVYAMAEEGFSVEKSKILFLSSNTWDVAGAKAYGFKVAWVNRFNGFIEELDQKPDLVLESLEELL